MSAARRPAAPGAGTAQATPGGGEFLAELAYRSAAEALRLQDAALTELRSRAGVVLAADAVGASFLAAAATRHGNLGAAGIAAVVLFLLCAASALYVLAPRGGERRRMIFALSGPELYTALYQERSDPEEVYRRLAYWLHDFWERNQNVIEPRYRVFNAAVVLLLLQLVVWALDLSGTL